MSDFAPLPSRMRVRKGYKHVYHLIYTMPASRKSAKFSSARSPTLDTVMMIEKAASESGGDATVRSLWVRLPRKVMWQTYLVALDYLESSGKLAVDSRRHVIWIWDPKEIARLKKSGLVVA